VTRLRDKRSGVESLQGKRFFLLCNTSRPSLGPTHPVVKRPGREVDPSPPYSAEVKNEAVSLFSLYAFMARRGAALPWPLTVSRSASQAVIITQPFQESTHTLQSLKKLLSHSFAEYVRKQNGPCCYMQRSFYRQRPRIQYRSKHRCLSTASQGQIVFGDTATRPTFE
jgi:hypothetical protein